MSNLNKWNRWYRGLEEPESYGDTASYQMGANFLANCESIQDWGCGKGWFRRFVEPHAYIGIDGSQTPFADVQVDLTEYRSKPEGIFMRHVLEHDYGWGAILNNAIESFQKRMVLVIFTPFSPEGTDQIAFADDPGVPDISFKMSDLTDCFDGLAWSMKVIESATQYGQETLFFLEKK